MYALINRSLRYVFLAGPISTVIYPYVCMSSVYGMNVLILAGCSSDLHKTAGRGYTVLFCMH